MVHTIVRGNTFYKWASGFGKLLSETAYVPIQPQSEGFVYSERNYAMSGRIRDDGTTTTVWTWAFLPEYYWEQLLDFYTGLSNGEANIPMTIFTRNNNNDWLLCDAWMEKPIAGTDARRNKRRMEQVVVRFIIRTAVVTDPE